MVNMISTKLTSEREDEKVCEFLMNLLKVNFYRYNPSTRMLKIIYHIFLSRARAYKNGM